MDMIFPVCGRRSSLAGTGSECSLNIAYNRQVPICSGVGAENANNGAAVADSLKCRGWGELCMADPGFTFSFEPSGEVSLPFSPR
jgi:integrin alpha FG-GAP repeat containing protein 1